MEDEFEDNFLRDFKKRDYYQYYSSKEFFDNYKSISSIHTEKKLKLNLEDEENKNRNQKINPSKEEKSNQDDDYLKHSDWNSQFQEINDIEDIDEKSSKLSTIIKNFHFSARVKKIFKNSKNI